MTKKQFVKKYRGSQASAQKAFLRDAERHSRKGYVPVSQTWAPGAYGCGEFLVALLLCFVLIGFLVFIYMLIVKPEGALVVTYELKSSQASIASDEGICPMCAETVKLAAKVCKHCGCQFKAGGQPRL